MTGSVTGSGSHQLRRAMGLRTATSTSTGLAFAALQYLAAAGLVTYVAGDSAWISIGVAGLLALVAWGFFGELNGMFPTAAAIRRYMSGAMDDRVALSVTFTYLTTIVLVVAADAFIVGAALTRALGVPSGLTALWTAVLLALAVMSNLRGVKVAGWVQDIATALVLAATIVVSVVALARSGHPLVTPLNPLGGHGTNLVESIALGVFLYSAFEWVTTNAEEVRRPEHVHRAMLLAVIILFGACALMTTALGHVLSRGQLLSATPQLYLGSKAFGGAGIWLMAAVTAVTAVNTFNGGFVTASRFMYATAREGSLPPLFSRLNDRAVPWVPVLALGIASFVLAVVVQVVGGAGWQVLVAVGATLEAMIYAVAAFCVLRLRARMPDHHRPFRVRVVMPLAGVGIAVFGTLALVSSVTVANRLNPAPLVVIAVVGAASGWYVVSVVPKLRAAEEARRAARTRRRPSRPAGGTAGPS
ncbi:MAG: APC family permease [Actinomycetota bacterium]|nr:APC family permease [Actinomycetota bacterium]